MKKIIFSFFAVLFITCCTTPTEEIDVAKEEEAIKALIVKEISHRANRDYDKATNTFKKADDIIAIGNTGRNHSVMVGWDSIYAANKSFLSREGWEEVTNFKSECTDFNIKVYDKVAWAIYYVQHSWEYKGEPYSNKLAKVTILEKIGDNWKYVLNSNTILNPCGEEDEEEDDE